MRRSSSWIEGLSKNFDVILPIHPGFGGSKFVPHIRKPADLALLYLSLLDQLGGSTVVIGSSFGGWIAADMAVKSCHSIARLVLIDSLGFKFSGPSEVEILDLYSSSPADVKAALYRDPELRDVDFSGADDQLLSHVVEDRTAEAYYGWSPYMHSPDLHRWLAPHLPVRRSCYGASKTASFLRRTGRRSRSRIPNAKFQTVPRAAHYPHIENPGSGLGFRPRLSEFALTATKDCPE